MQLTARRAWRPLIVAAAGISVLAGAAWIAWYLAIGRETKDTTVSLTISRALADAGVKLAWDGDGLKTVPLRPGDQHFPGFYGANSVLLLCPPAEHPIDMFGWASTNWRHGIDTRIACGGTVDQIKCAFTSGGVTTWICTTCARHDPLHASWRCAP